CPNERIKTGGFTLAEVLIAIAVSVIFATAAFATNKWLLLALRSQKESTAASMMLQERMEAFRGIYYSNAASNITTGTTSPATTTAADIVQTVTTSEAQIGSSLTETLTVSGYMTTTGGTGYPGDGSTPNQWTRNG